MSVKKYSNSEIKNQMWIKDGRGSGRGRSYKPWLTVRDLASKGRSHRIFGHKSQRTHHLLSDLELAVFLLLEWHEDTEEIREQFPLRLDDTKALAQKAGINHPSLNGFLQIMSSDFLVDTRDKLRPKFVLQAKYSSALQDPRTVEKLELERRYWQKKEVPWMLVTEQDIPRVLFQNISWLYPAQRDTLDYQHIPDRIEFYWSHFQKSPDRSVIEIAQTLDTAYELEPGQSLLELRRLLSQRCFLFNISIPFRKLRALDLEVGDIPALMEVCHVSN